VISPHRYPELVGYVCILRRREAVCVETGDGGKRRGGRVRMEG
jgi:hypothetical protein